LPEDHPAPVVVWEERPRGLDWVPWTLSVVVIAGVGAGIVYALARAPGPGAYLVIAAVVLCISSALLASLVRRAVAKTPGRITLDLDRRRLYAENLRLARGFWPTRPTPMYECALNDIRSFRVRRSRYTQWLHIHTPDGLLCIDDKSTGFDELRDAVSQIAPRQPGWMLKDVVVAVVASVVAGLICWACVHFGWI
jgi:hypothetical protein